MKRQYLFLIIGLCFYLLTFGQRKSSNSTSLLHQYSVQDMQGQLYESEHRVIQRNLRPKYLFKEKLDSIIVCSYDEMTSAWNKQYIKEAFEYDDNCNEIAWVYSVWSAGDNKWLDCIKEESQYDELINGVVNIQFVWSNDQWNKERKWECIYNEDKVLIQKLCYKWRYDLDDWQLTEKLDCSYNAQGQPLTDSLYAWYVNSQKWQLQEKIDYEYINDNELHYVFYSSWDSVANKCVERRKEWYLYDLQWRLITLSSYEWDNASDDHWRLTNRKGYSYDENDYLKRNANVFIKPPVEDGSIQHNISWKTYEFDFSFFGGDILLSNYLTHQEFKFHHKLLNTSLSKYNPETKQEERYGEVGYYYSTTIETGTDTQHLFSEAVNVYPNPAREIIYVNCPSEYFYVLFELYNIDGNKIISSTINNAESIDISALEKGLYVYYIKYDQYVSIGKLIKD